MHAPGSPDVLRLEETPDPEPREGEVLIAVRAFGLNRSELFTRQGHSPGVEFPRVLGIECVGEVIAAPGTRFAPGDRVAAIMGGMGRQYDGGYAELTRVPAAHVYRVQTHLPWEVFGALPEMFQTAQGSLTTGLRAQPGETLLVRGGTSSIGMTAAALAADLGMTVLATTRSEAKADALRTNGAHHVLRGGGSLVEQVRAIAPDGVDCVLELIGATTLLDSLRCARVGGRVCMTGILGGSWTLPDFEPMTAIPTGVFLTAYSGGSGDLTEEALEGFLRRVAAGSFTPRIDRVFGLHEVAAAHAYMEANRAKGKLVVRV